MPQISIIIPIYNTERYLSDCLDSVINQTIQDIEIICVNDGSTDNSAQIIEEYALKDNRIKVLHKENGGQTSSRRAGLELATGEYIGFVDSDDWIDSDMYEKMLSIAERYQVDMVSSGYYLEGNYTTKHLDTVEYGLYDADNIQDLRDNTIYCVQRKETGLRGSMCCKIFKRNILMDTIKMVPDSISIAEDKMSVITYMLYCNSAYVMPEAFYHWVIHQGSMSRRADENYLVNVNEVYKYLISLYSHKNFSEQMRTQAEIYIMELLVLGMNKRLGFTHTNVFRVDPSWMDSIPQGSKIIIYGGGDLGEQYIRQLNRRKDIVLVKYLEFEIPTYDELSALKFDYILITIKNRTKANDVKEQFVKLGINEDKILWFEQPEVYWKYALAEGWLDS